MKTLELNGKMVCFHEPEANSRSYSVQGEYLYYILNSRAAKKRLPSGYNFSILGWSDEITSQQISEHGLFEIYESDGAYPYADVMTKYDGAEYYDSKYAWLHMLVKEQITTRVLVVVGSKN